MVMRAFFVFFILTILSIGKIKCDPKKPDQDSQKATTTNDNRYVPNAAYNTGAYRHQIDVQHGVPPGRYNMGFYPNDMTLGGGRYHTGYNTGRYNTGYNTGLYNTGYNTGRYGGRYAGNYQFDDGRYGGGYYPYDDGRYGAGYQYQDGRYGTQGAYAGGRYSTQGAYTADRYPYNTGYNRGYNRGYDYNRHPQQVAGGRYAYYEADRAYDGYGRPAVGYGQAAGGYGRAEFGRSYGYAVGDGYGRAPAPDAYFGNAAGAYSAADRNIRQVPAANMPVQANMAAQTASVQK